MTGPLPDPEPLATTMVVTSGDRDDAMLSVFAASGRRLDLLRLWAATADVWVLRDLLGDDHGPPAAAALVVPGGHGTVELRALNVGPSGVAGRFVAGLLARLRASGASRVTAVVSERQPDAVAALLESGFTVRALAPGGRSTEDGWAEPIGTGVVLELDL